MGLFRMQKGRLRWDLIHLHKYLKGGDKEDKARLLSVVPSDRTGGHGPRLRRFPLNIRKYVFHGRMTNHWHRLPREVAQCPSKFSHMMEADHLEGSFVIRVSTGTIVQREAVESPSFKVFQSLLDIALDSLLYVAVLDKGNWTR